MSGNTRRYCAEKRVVSEHVSQDLSRSPRAGLTRADLLTPDEVAALLSVPVSTVRDWARRGVLPSRKLGRHRRFLRSEVERWVVDEQAA